MKRLVTSAVAALTLAMAANVAQAQSVRFYTKDVARGQSVDFDNWLNYDETSCFDRGHPRFSIISPPKLGRLVPQRSRFAPQGGACAGRRLSVLVIRYLAGRTPGTDQFSYSIVGNDPFTVNGTVTVR